MFLAFCHVYLMFLSDGQFFVVSERIPGSVCTVFMLFCLSHELTIGLSYYVLTCYVVIYTMDWWNMCLFYRRILEKFQFEIMSRMSPWWISCHFVGQVTHVSFHPIFAGVCVLCRIYLCSYTYSVLLFLLFMFDVFVVLLLFYMLYFGRAL